MRVFLSWSQRRSRAIAELWRNFLPDVIQSVRTFLSSVDLEAGARWTADLADALGDMDHGIICITPENKLEPWIHFEAGALSKNVGKAKVIPCLYDISVAQLPPSLGQFNCRAMDRVGVWDIVTSINNDLSDGGLDAIRLKKAFDKHFPDFQAELGAIAVLSDEEKAGVKPDKSLEQMVAEILTTLRRAGSPQPIRPSPKGYENVAIVEFDQMTREIIDAAREKASPELWHLFNRRLTGFADQWAGLLTIDVDNQIRTVATECTLFVIATREDHEKRMQRIVQHTCAAANSLKVLLLGTPIVRAE
jgi:hypothetical protein